MERFGVKFELARDGLVFSGRGIRPSARMPEEMASVVIDPDGLSDWDGPLYLVYRDMQRLASGNIRKEFSRHKIQYDLTFIFPGFVGDEYVKTHGHFHPVNPGTRRYYGEIYEVLRGRALFLLQHRKLEDFLVIEAKKGQGVSVPGDYGHVTVNVGKRPLVLGNLVANFKADYASVEKRHGLAYYVLNGPTFVPNPRYQKHPTMIWLKAEKMPPLDEAFFEDKDVILETLEIL